MNYMPKQKGTMNKRAVGSHYEGLATAYLLKKGYVILENNYRCKLGEIDIIAKWHEYIVFIEVKYRKTKQFGYPREAVTYQKIQHIVRTAQYYLKTNVGYEKACRFDVIEILGEEITHLEAAF